MEVVPREELLLLLILFCATVIWYCSKIICRFPFVDFPNQNNLLKKTSINLQAEQRRYLMTKLLLIDLQIIVDLQISPLNWFKSCRESERWLLWSLFQALCVNEKNILTPLTPHARLKIETIDNSFSDVLVSEINNVHLAAKETQKIYLIFSHV